jgi:hypothetical protein
VGRRIRISARTSSPRLAAIERQRLRFGEAKAEDYLPV